jgi:hypothetical protein
MADLDIYTAGLTFERVVSDRYMIAAAGKRCVPTRGSIDYQGGSYEH